jgi:hypothetical protein
MTQPELDLKQLCAQAPFRRFLLQVIRSAGIFSPTAGASETLPFREGQRSLGLDILSLASRGLPRGTSTEQMIALVLASEANPKETDDDNREPDPERE